jgi:hypothetical protein
MERITIAHAMNNRSDDHLRASVATSNARHVEASLCGS